MNGVRAAFSAELADPPGPDADADPGADRSGADRSGADRSGADLGLALQNGGTAGRAEQFRPAVLALRLSAFRNYPMAVLETDGRDVVLIGPNGAGKTNLLEALSLLAPGRGLRRARMDELQHQPAQGRGETPAGPVVPWAVAAEIATPAGLVQVGTGRDPASVARAPALDDENEDGQEGAGRRLLRIDGAPQRSLAALAGLLGIAWLTPAMDGLFREGAGGRRRFLDRIVFGLDPAHAGRVSAYETALRERQRLLRDGAGDPAWLTACEETIASRGVAVAAARLDAVARLSCLLERGFGHFPTARIALSGTVEGWLETMPALATEDRFRDALAAQRGPDAQSGMTAIGPHRSDLDVLHLARGTHAARCSTGEQKALLITLALAGAELAGQRRGLAPVLLLDEVAAHLDGVRRGALAEALACLGGQCWLTGTDTGMFEPWRAGGAGRRGRALFVAVEDAAIRPIG